MNNEAEVIDIGTGGAVAKYNFNIEEIKKRVKESLDVTIIEGDSMRIERDVFQEFSIEALTALNDSILAVIAAHTDRLKFEKEAEERKAEAERLKQQKEAQEAEAARLQKIADEQAEAQKKIDDEKARIETEKKAEIERREREEFQRKAKIEAEEKAQRDAKLKAENDEKERIAKEEAYQKEVAKFEALKPDKKKISDYVTSIREVELPDLKCENSKEVTDKISKAILDDTHTINDVAMIMK